jgi:SAM-dependent methyltransferase
MIGSEDNYFIKSEYVVRATRNVTNESHYWDADRIYTSEFYQYHVYQYAHDLFVQQGMSTVADVGCGVATKLAMFEDVAARIVGIDKDEAIEYCKENFKAPVYDFHIDDLEHPKVTIDSLDMIICADVIEHLLHPEHLLEYIRHLAAPATYIVLSTPERDLLRGRRCQRSPRKEHVREWNRQELRLLLEHFGFTVLEQFVTWPVKLAANRLLYPEIIKRYLTGKRAAYNQIALCRCRPE